VADEMREALERLSSLTAAKSPDAFEIPHRKARFVRVTIHKTNGSTQPCIDELEIFGPGGKENLALAARGAIASASSLLPGYPIHQVRHLNDGLYGNDHSWIAASNKVEWAQIELPAPAVVASVLVTRDRSGKFTDRIPQVFEVLVSADGQQWQSAGRCERRPRCVSTGPRCREASHTGAAWHAWRRWRGCWCFSMS
jgi:hypothetical protein